MERGKEICKALKQIRREIAKANDIELVISECKHKGDCLGTCPKCEAEVRYLEEQLARRQRLGLVSNVAGLSVGLAAVAPVFFSSCEVLTDAIEAIGNSTQTQGMPSEPPLGGDPAPFQGLICSGKSMEIMSAFLDIETKEEGTLYRVSLYSERYDSKPETVTPDVCVEILGDTNTLTINTENGPLVFNSEGKTPETLTNSSYGCNIRSMSAENGRTIYNFEVYADGTFQDGTYLHLEYYHIF